MIKIHGERCCAQATLIHAHLIPMKIKGKREREGGGQNKIKQCKRGKSRLVEIWHDILIEIPAQMESAPHKSCNKFYASQSNDCDSLWHCV